MCLFQFCRICLDGNQKEELVRVCRCNGSVGLTHQTCVLTWFQATGQKACELCKYPMDIERAGIKSFAKVNRDGFDTIGFKDDH